MSRPFSDLYHVLNDAALSIENLFKPENQAPKYIKPGLRRLNSEVNRTQQISARNQRRLEKRK